MTKHTVIWVDANSSDPNNSFRMKLGDAQLFSSSDDGCEPFIKSHPETSIYLIVSGSVAQTLLPKVYNCDNLVKVFVFCGSVINYVEWALDYCDKLMMFDHGDDLLERLWNDLESHFRQQAKQCLKCADDYKQLALQYKQPSCG